MILRFKTGKGHFLNVNFSTDCYNLGETPGRNYISITDKDYSNILAEIDFNSFDYSEDLGTGEPSDFHPFTRRDLNAMCYRCEYLGNLCEGTTNSIYSGCIWKDAGRDSFEKFLKMDI